VRLGVQRLAHGKQSVLRSQLLQARRTDRQLAAAQRERLQEDSVGNRRQPLTRSRDAHEALGAVVKRRQVLVADWPVVPRPAPPEVALTETPGEGVPQQGLAAHGGHERVVDGFAGRVARRNARGVEEARIVVGAVATVEASVGELERRHVRPEARRRHPVAALEHHDAQAELGQLLGRDAPRRPGTHDAHVEDLAVDQRREIRDSRRSHDGYLHAGGKGCQTSAAVAPVSAPAPNGAEDSTATKKTVVVLIVQAIRRRARGAPGRLVTESIEAQN